MEPPALPVKQHRSHSSRSSSGHDCGPLSPVELHSSNTDDVFPEATDCHAAQCPIHQRYDSSQHLMRFFSDDAPPPVPRKRLARALSLPCAKVPPPSPLSPRLRLPRDFDNPLYMMMPVRSPHFTVETVEEFHACREGSEPTSPYSRVSLDMSDEQLLHLFGGFTDQWEVLQGIQHCHLVFLKSMAQRVDAGILLQRDSRGKEVDSYLPQDFVLQEGSEARQVGDAVYYRLHSPKFPGRPLALKVHRQSDESPSAAVTHQPPHANVQEVVAHFRPRDITSSSFAEPEVASVQSFLQRGHPVSVERDLPLFTLEDFVQSGASLQASDYDGRLSALMLQVLNGLAHLHQNGSSVSELRPGEVFLVWPLEGQEEGGKYAEVREESGLERTEEKSAKMGLLWRTHGCPRVVLIPAGSSLTGRHTLLFIKSQINALIHFCLQSRDSRISTGAALSSQQRELLRLASMLQGNGPQLEAVVAALQELVWGPGVPLCGPWFHHWLTVKRALFVMKLAERGLSPERPALQWEDVMRLKYLSSADGEATVGVSA